jgi:thiol-disulfide isomerase/thioredoxin
MVNLSNISQKWFIFCIIVLFSLNIVLLRRLSILSSETGTWKTKVTMSMGEQLIFLAHLIEGDDLSLEIEKLRRSIPRFNHLFTNSKKHKLIYHFWGTNCRNCMNMEIKIFNKLKHSLQRNKIDVIMIFSDFEEKDYHSTIQQYKIHSYSVRDKTSTILKKFNYIRNPIVLLLSRENKILLANLPDYKDEHKSLIFYEKIDHLMRDYYAIRSESHQKSFSPYE